MATNTPKTTASAAGSDGELGFLSMAQACELLALSTTKVYRLARAGELRSGKIGRKTVIERASALAFMRRVLSVPRWEDESPIAAKARAASRARRG